jgi:hypothetical protein
MGTAKKYQYKGAATLQVQKFTALADEINAIVSSASSYFCVLLHYFYMVSTAYVCYR